MDLGPACVTNRYQMSEEVIEADITYCTVLGLFFGVRSSAGPAGLLAAQRTDVYTSTDRGGRCIDSWAR